MSHIAEHEKPRSDWTTVDGLKMHARVLGSENAPPVVLVHGLVVSALYMMRTLKLPAQTHGVYAPDLPGFGASEKPVRALGVGRSWRTLRYALDDPIEDRLPAVRAPVLVVHGSRDPISPDPGPRGSPGTCPAERSSSSKGLPKPRITPLPQSSSARSDRSSTRRGRVARASPRFGSLLPDRLRGQERQEGPVEVLRPVEHGVVARPLDDEESAVWDLRPHQI